MKPFINTALRVWLVVAALTIWGTAMPARGEEAVPVLTGCLTHDAEQNQYTLTEESGRQVAVAGVSELKKHTDQMVRIEGFPSSNGRYFQAVVVKRVSPACTPLPDPASEEITAEQQGNSPADRRTTRLIRQALIADKSLSTFAHNVQVITRDGAVTLKGLVKSESEKQTVEEKAISVAGASRVRNLLRVGAAEEDHPDSRE